MENKKWWLLPAILGGVSLVVLVLFIILLCVNNIEPLAIDESVRDFFYDIRGEKGGFIYWLFRILTEFGDIIGLAILAVVLAVITKVDYRVCLFVIGAALAHLFNDALKEIFERVRPFENMQWQSESSKSFPSGHSKNASFMFSFIMYIAYKSNIKDVFKKTLYIACPIMIVIVMVSRLVLGVHYFSDVCAGCAVGLIFTALMIVLYHICEKKQIFTTNLYDIIKTKRAKKAE